MPCSAGLRAVQVMMDWLEMRCGTDDEEEEDEAEEDDEEEDDEEEDEEEEDEERENSPVGRCTVHWTAGAFDERWYCMY